LLRSDAMYSNYWEQIVLQILKNSRKIPENSINVFVSGVYILHYCDLGEFVIVWIRETIVFVKRSPEYWTCNFWLAILDLQFLTCNSWLQFLTAILDLLSKNSNKYLENFCVHMVILSTCRQFEALTFQRG
jgi:hypothetical protein